MKYLGLGKTIFNSSVCLLDVSDTGSLDFETFLTERELRRKYAGNWPMVTLQRFLGNPLPDAIADSRDVSSPGEYEDALDRSFPFYHLLEQKSLTAFSRKYNPTVKTIGHHDAHAFGALAFSPFEKALILVFDGAGSSARELRNLRTCVVDPSIGDEAFECVSVYIQDRHQLKLVKKEFLTFQKGARSGKIFSGGVGLFYETISEFIFNSKHDAGKVMGLAPFGTPLPVKDRFSFLDSLDWTKKFQGRGKDAWEASPHLDFYRNLAATAQALFEAYLEDLLRELKSFYPDYQNLIMTGGCALNCTANWKMQEKGFFEAIHVLPFPGDESIGLGCAYALHHDRDPLSWRPVAQAMQTSFLGPRSSVPEEEKIRKLFSHHHVTYCASIADKAAEALAAGKVIAWFQGRSECGPRALGHRSILARPERKALKHYLNTSIKFREEFRPYGCTVIFEKASRYFAIPEGFHNPFMSFAVPVREEWKKQLKEISHIDGTSRMQTLCHAQEPLFYELLEKVEALTGLPILLNTSLNIMGEPILETPEDALRFFEQSAVDGVCIGPFWIERKKP